VGKVVCKNTGRIYTKKRMIGFEKGYYKKTK
jgi:hypothetical protein